MPYDLPLPLHISVTGQDGTKYSLDIAGIVEINEEEGGSEIMFNKDNPKFILVTDTPAVVQDKIDAMRLSKDAVESAPEEGVLVSFLAQDPNTLVFIEPDHVLGIEPHERGSIILYDPVIDPPHKFYVRKTPDQVRIALRDNISEFFV
jgi:hypothetical protein